VEQAGTMGKGRPIRVNDRPPLDPIFGTGSKIATVKCAILDCILVWVMRELVAIAITIAVCAARAATLYRDAIPVKR